MRVRTAAAIFALVAGLAVLGLVVWTLVGMIQSARRRARSSVDETSGEASGRSKDGSGDDP